MKVIYNSFKIKDFALNVFKELYSYDQFKALETYIVEKVASDGAIQFSFKDGNDSIQGCFLSPYAIVQKRNNPKQRWFEDRGFSIKNTEVFLSDQWYGDDRHNSTAILPLQYFVETSYRNIYKIENNSGEFKLIKMGDTMNHLDKPKSPQKNFYQTIFFGAPGTGKSHKIDYNLFKDEHGNPIGMGIKEVPEVRKFRTTFHPDYDYAQFVGAYKPRVDEKSPDKKIIYSFVPQVFAKAYVKAWSLFIDAGRKTTPENQVYLVIEEINRGNCAQIFGDIFQLLDRKNEGDEKGFSQYAIDADCDFAEWLETNDGGLKSVWEKYKETVGDGKLKLPPNLNILATMNTSDQSLFPMDSAFKRRFDWEYVPISFEGKDAANYQIDIDGSFYSWKNFVETVNDKILDLTESEDKQLGEFFIKPDSGYIISKDRFLGKVMFYLWNEVCKDEHKNGSFFRAKINDKEDFFTFQDLYKKKDLLKLFMDELLKKE